MSPLKVFLTICNAGTTLTEASLTSSLGMLNTVPRATSALNFPTLSPPVSSMVYNYHRTPLDTYHDNWLQQDDRVIRIILAVEYNSITRLDTTNRGET